MSFDFESTVDRNDQGSLNNHELDERIRARGLVAFSAAEMDFPTAPCILEAYEKRVRNGLFGYTLCDDGYLSAVVRWMSTRRDFPVDREAIVPTYGTIFALSTAIRAFTDPGDRIIVQRPVYMRYEQAIARNGRLTLNNPLIYQNGAYTMDFDDLDHKMSDPGVKLMILCNPHNPVGRVWTRAELLKVAEIAARNRVIVFSDEIFAEIAFDGHRTIAYGSIESERSIVATSLGKAFNFTGVNHANIIITDDTLRDAFRRQRDTDHYGSIDPLAYTATIAAYTRGGEWLDAATQHIRNNIELIRTTFETHLPGARICSTEGTFVMWIDWRSYGMSESELMEFLIGEAYTQLERGSSYGEEGRGFARMSVATSRANLERALTLLVSAAERRGFDRD